MFFPDCGRVHVHQLSTQTQRQQSTKRCARAIFKTCVSVTVTLNSITASSVLRSVLLLQFVMYHNRFGSCGRPNGVSACSEACQPKARVDTEYGDLFAYALTNSNNGARIWIPADGKENNCTEHSRTLQASGLPTNAYIAESGVNSRVESCS